MTKTEKGQINFGNGERGPGRRRGKAQQGEGQQGQGQGRRGGGKVMEFLFKKFDQNQDGKISESEAPDRMKQRLDTIDTDGDRAVSREELQAAFEKASQNGGKGLGNKGNGNKGNKAGGKGNRGAQIDPAALFQRVDTNGDGAITPEEAPDRMKKRFDQVDADGNGSISVEELTSVFEKMKQGGKKKGGGNKGGQLGRNKSADADATLPVKPKRPPFEEGA